MSDARANALWAASLRGPTKPVLADASASCRDLLDYAATDVAFLNRVLAGFSDVALAEMVRRAKVVERHERSHRACVLYVAEVGGYDAKDTWHARRGHHVARRLVSIATAEAARRVEKYRTGLTLLRRMAS